MEGPMGTPKDDGFLQLERGIEMLVFWGVYIHNDIKANLVNVYSDGFPRQRDDMSRTRFVYLLFCCTIFYRLIDRFLSANGFQKRSMLDWH